MIFYDYRNCTVHSTILEYERGTAGIQQVSYMFENNIISLCSRVGIFGAFIHEVRVIMSFYQTYLLNSVFLFQIDSIPSYVDMQ